MTWLAVRAFLGGVWTRLTAAFSALIGWVSRNPWPAAVIALCAVSALLWHGGNVARHERDAARAEIVAIHAAQKTAGAAQAAVNHEPARKSAEIARTSDAEAPAYYDSVRRAAAANVVRPPANPISRPDLPGANRAEPGVHGPDPLAGLVCRPEADDGQLVNAAARAAKMHQEALDLIAAGVAEYAGTTTIPTH